jgi:hypothetical protein
MSSAPLRDGLHVNRHDDHLHFTAVLDGKVVDIKLWPPAARGLAQAIQDLSDEAAAHPTSEGRADRQKRLWSRA